MARFLIFGRSKVPSLEDYKREFVDLRSSHSADTFESESESLRDVLVASLGIQVFFRSLRRSFSPYRLLIMDNSVDNGFWEE